MGPLQRQQVVTALAGDAVSLVRNRNACQVYVELFVQGSDADREEIFKELLGEPTLIKSLAKSQWGCFIVRELLKAPGEHSGVARKYLADGALEVKQTRCGAQLLNEFII